MHESSKAVYREKHKPHLEFDEKIRFKDVPIFTNLIIHFKPIFKLYNTLKLKRKYFSIIDKFVKKKSGEKTRFKMALPPQTSIVSQCCKFIVHFIHMEIFLNHR